MCSHLTGACIDRPDFNVKRAPGMLAHEVPAKPKEGEFITLDVLDAQEARRREEWRSRFSPPDLDSLLA